MFRRAQSFRGARQTGWMTVDIASRERMRDPVWLRQPATVEAVAAVVTVLSAAIEVVRVILGDGSPLALVGLALGLLAATLVRTRPVFALLLAAAGPILTGSTGWPPIVEYSIAIFVLFRFTLRGGPPLRGALLVSLGAYVGVVWARDVLYAGDGIASVVSAFAGAILGVAFRSHQQYWASLEQRATDAVATRELEADRRVAEERIRIARDLHDVMGHQVAILSMQLGVAEVFSTTNTEASVKALHEARSAVKAVLLETHRILRVLRSDDESESPTPGMADLDLLAASFETLGLHVQINIDSDLPPTDPAVEVTIYRMVQEALTNAHRYGDGQASVTVRGLEEGTVVRVSNPYSVSGAVRSGSGYGLMGMDERVASTGGVLHIAREGGVFVVTATFDIGREGQE